MLWVTHPLYLEHLTGPRHPERPSRLTAVVDAARDQVLDGALVPVEPEPASREDLERVHPSGYIDRLEQLSAGGGGWIDGDTVASPQSMAAAELAAGAGLTAVRELRAGACFRCVLCGPAARAPRDPHAVDGVLPRLEHRHRRRCARRRR